ECISHITVTTPSFASILTSKQPISHGVLDNFYGGYFLDNQHTTMAELLKNKGYATAAFIGGYNMKQKTNLSQGFDLYNDNFRIERNAALVNEDVLPWIEEHKDNKFFLFIHYYDPHGKYAPPAPYNHYFDFTTNEYDTNKIPNYQRKNGITDPSFYIAQYDGEIAFTDYRIGRVLGKISELGLQSETLIIFTSDHGETMAEHHWWFDHGCFVFEEQIHVPLLLYYPKMFKHKRIETMVSHIDILPTVLNILDIGFSKDVEGRSLLPLVREGVWQNEFMFCESGRGDPKRNKNILKGIEGKQFAVRSKEWKLIRTNKTTGINYELYNLVHDPEELNNLVGQTPTIEKELKARLTVFLQNYENSPYYTGRTNRCPNRELSRS
ncbi:MAG: sulfatase, partial [Deltaproteobacteria bacterium]|nr:sulfatase [Deltaproteobacteria bacterium]